MIELIRDVPNQKAANLVALQKTTAPIIMYGAGSYAVDVATFLKRHNVEIDTYCIDKAYLQPGQKFLGTHQVSALEDVAEQHDTYNIVIGFNDFKKAYETLAPYKDKAEIFFFDAPHQLDFFDYGYIKQHQAEFESTYNLLQDEMSKKVFIAFINAKISGDPSGLYDLVDFNQYFSDPVVLNTDEVFVDCGAYDGDTIRSFLTNTNGKYRKIFAFEPDTENFKKLTTYIEEAKLSNVVINNTGTWSTQDTLHFSSDGNMAAIVADKGDFSIKVDTIDNIVGDEDVTYIKMDIEGAELESLKGAQNAIKRSKPKLAICAYHKPEDLITLPQYIQSLSDEYVYYLRHHQLISWEMVLYALPK